MSVTPLSRKLFISTMDDRLEVNYWLDRPLEVLSRRTSLERGWTRFQASLIHVAGGSSQPALLARHNVTMLVGSALATAAACDGVTAARLQEPGQFDVLPARSSVSWVDRGNSVFLAVGLEHELVRSTALEMGLDPDRVAFAPQLTCRDPQIEHLLWALKAELETDEPYGRLYADSLGVALASQILRRWSHRHFKPLARSLTGALLKRVLAYIHDAPRRRAVARGNRRGRQRQSLAFQPALQALRRSSGASVCHAQARGTRGRIAHAHPTATM